MTVATALIAGNKLLPQLAEAALAQALASAGLTRGNGVLSRLASRLVGKPSEETDVQSIA